MTLKLKHCDIEPGDIIMLVSSSSKFQARLKRFAQSIGLGESSKHGHREVISVFVCTDRNAHGVVCNNYQKQLGGSTKAVIETLRGLPNERLERMLNSYKKKLSLEQLQSALKKQGGWMSQLASSQQKEDGIPSIIDKIIAAKKDNKEDMVLLLTLFWQASGESEILPTSHSTLLVFKPTDPEIRQRFLKEYRNEVQVTQEYAAQKKDRTSGWRAFRAIFRSSTKDEKDRTKIDPSEETYCSRQVIQVLNKVDPSLVDRGRHITPKTLEAGLRESAKRKVEEPLEPSGNKNGVEQQALAPADDPLEDDFEQLLAGVTAKKKPEAPFKMVILPAAGKELVRQLIASIDKEIFRINNKKSKNSDDTKKADDLSRLLAPFRTQSSVGISGQVETALELTATILPVLQRKTGFWGGWIASTSYSNIRTFLRTQGIFDGDIRDAVERLGQKKTAPILDVEAHPEVAEGNTKKSSYVRLLTDMTAQPSSLDTIKDKQEKSVYIFCDWSFLNWSAEKREKMLAHMTGLLDSADVFIRQNGDLVKMTKETLEEAINMTNIDNLIAPELTPTTRAQILEQARKQLPTEQIALLDYQACQQLVPDQGMPANLDKTASLFSPKKGEYDINRKKIEIIDIEIENATDDPKQKEDMVQLKKDYEAQSSALRLRGHVSGVDTKAALGGKRTKELVFKPVSFMSPTPLPSYYREAVHTNLVVNQKPSTSFEYFELQGMHATDALEDCDYEFCPNGLTDKLIQQEKTKAPKAALFKGTKNLELSRDWQPLPSLHPGESLLKIAIKGLDKDKFEIKSSEQNQLYYIRLREPLISQKCECNFLLKMPKEYTAHPKVNTLSSLKDHPQHKGIYNLLQKYYKFGKDDGGLREAGKMIKDGQCYLNKAKELGVGSCRIRTFAFKQEMAELYPDIPVVIVENKKHFFIEMKIDGAWSRYCLGGYRDVPTLADNFKARFATQVEPSHEKDQESSLSSGNN
jgi:hypothetical protein